MYLNLGSHRTLLPIICIFFMASDSIGWCKKELLPLFLAAVTRAIKYEFF